MCPLIGQQKPMRKSHRRLFTEVPYKHGFVEDLLIRPALEGNKYSVGWDFHKVQLVMCECLLNSSALLQEVLLSEVLDISNVVVVTGSPNDMLTAYRKAPLPLSFVPIRGSGFPSNMTFIQRVRTLVDYFFVRLLMDFCSFVQWTI